MKRLVASLLCISFSLTSTLRADATEETSTPVVSDAVPATPTTETVTESTAQPSSQPLATEPAADQTNAEDATPEVPETKVVGKASEEASQSASRERWTNIALAAGAVVVATVALILVSQNQGKPSSDN